MFLSFNLSALLTFWVVTIVKILLKLRNNTVILPTWPHILKYFGTILSIYLWNGRRKPVPYKCHNWGHLFLFLVSTLSYCFLGVVCTTFHHPRAVWSTGSSQSFRDSMKPSITQAIVPAESENAFPQWEKVYNVVSHGWKCRHLRWIPGIL